MNYQLFVFCPDDETIINKIIDAASNAGAGILENYSHCAFVTRGKSQWKSEQGAHPSEGKVGELTKVTGAKIEMRCSEKKRIAVEKAIRKVHPYEEPDIQFILLS
ncbi:hypothetical protein A2363_02485 [Candidatus Gottesmanbacteria bacterium RIFOXYB1_FULL_47_11]|uniref:NGG1p interacting factor NIF3 n=1 Tax=Candidatus Gottesmanbacteria bacterium RIFOXYB1_FULL_47_11 TaxID=1798401 RepID=A0A1F6BEG3_9BACT|nr:MAG: hypothetical protein A2363_02485 [Candidatus Gottesmanbacteria bacterium RIFOXYB1_FULL_47_11]